MCRRGPEKGWQTARPTRCGRAAHGARKGRSRRSVALAERETGCGLLRQGRGPGPKVGGRGSRGPPAGPGRSNGTGRGGTRAKGYGRSSSVGPAPAAIRRSRCAVRMQMQNSPSPPGTAHSARRTEGGAQGGPEGPKGGHPIIAASRGDNDGWAAASLGMQSSQEKLDKRIFCLDFFISAVCSASGLIIFHEQQRLPLVALGYPSCHC